MHIAKQQNKLKFLQQNIHATTLHATVAHIRLPSNLRLQPRKRLSLFHRTTTAFGSVAIKCAWDTNVVRSYHDY